MIVSSVFLSAFALNFSTIPSFLNAAFPGSYTAEKVIVPENVTCCGWAGDRGFFHPELNRSALAPLEHAKLDATEGYSNSRTCEIGLSVNSGIAYKSLVYLVDKCTAALEINKQ